MLPYVRAALPKPKAPLQKSELPVLANKWLVRKLTDGDKRNPTGPAKQPNPTAYPLMMIIIERYLGDHKGYYDAYPDGVPDQLWEKYLEAFPVDPQSDVGWWNEYISARDAITQYLKEADDVAKVPLQDYPPIQTRQQVMDELKAHHTNHVWVDPATLETTFQAEMRAALKAHDEELLLLDSRIWEMEKAGHSSLGQMRSDRKSVAFKMPRRLMAGKHTQ